MIINAKNIPLNIINRVNSIPNGAFIDTQYPNLDQCKDTNEIINEIGGFCITNKTNIISIHIGKCTNDLIKYYNYPEDTKFYILGIDSHNKLSNSSINNYQYYIYNENRT